MVYLLMTVELFLIKKEHGAAFTFEHFFTMLEDSIIVHQLVKSWAFGSCRRRARRSIIRWAQSAIVLIPDVSLQIAESAEGLPASCTLIHCEAHPLDTWSDVMSSLAAPYLYCFGRVT